VGVGAADKYWIYIVYIDRDTYVDGARLGICSRNHVSPAAELSIPPQPSITLRNGDFDPETYFSLPSAHQRVYVHAENVEKSLRLRH